MKIALFAFACLLSTLVTAEVEQVCYFSGLLSFFKLKKFIAGTKL